MKMFFGKGGKKSIALLLLLAAVMLCPGGLGEAAVAVEADGEPLFDDEAYYPWLYDQEDADLSEEVMALVNQMIQRDYDGEIADWCQQKAEELPENDTMRKGYEEFALILRETLPGRPSEEESRALSEQYLANISSQLEEEAVAYYRRCVEAEPEITRDLFDVAEAVGAEMYGIGFRLKSAGEDAQGVCRIADKVTEAMQTAEAAGAPITYREAVESIQDVVRYTLLGTPDTLVWNYLLTKEKLEEKGYHFILVKNTWETYSIKRPYRGVNVKVQAPSGIIFELQFHTTEGLVIKMVDHANYEVRRNPLTSAEERARLVKQAYELYDALTEPESIELIK